MKDEELLSRVEQLRRKTSAVRKASLQDNDQTTSLYAKWVEDWIEAVLTETGKPKCKFCGSTKVRYADQKELFSDSWVRVMVCGKCGRQSDVK
jgi:DNA-directed RNA polymerase subunit M/transcription elongation factor TFIIS